MSPSSPGASGPLPAVLVVDDEPRILDALEAVLAADFRVLRAGGGEAALEILRTDEVAVIVTDYRMPGMTGVELLRRSQEVAPDALRLVLTAYTDVDSLMEAINTGRIHHFVSKPWDPLELTLVVRRAAEHYELARENARLRDELELAYNAARRDVAATRPRPLTFDRLIGAQTGLRDAIALVGKVIDSTTTVLLRGETGTGKELFARLVHDNGPRRTATFLAQNCAALSESLLESELFGHARGAFTGAIAERRGLFEDAHGGTILLDEVGEMSPATQLRFLRVLQEGEVRRVGESVIRKVDVRIIAATNADLEAQVARGTFRADLYYRLNVFPVTLPALRERRGDIPALAEHFLRVHRERARRTVTSFTPAALRCLRAYPFPGNVRELENEVQRAVALADHGGPIDLEHLSPRIREGGGPLAPTTLNDAIEQLKRRMLEDALRECGSKTRAAERLGLTRQSLQQMLRRRQA